MNTCLPLRRYLLLLGAFSWLLLPVSVSAGPGGGGGHSSGGGHFGGGHVGGGNSGGHNGGHWGRGASSGGAVSGPSVANHGRSEALSTGPRTGGTGFNNLSSFVPDNSVNPGHGTAGNPELSQLAAHGWTFVPSAGVSRPAASPRAAVRPVNATRIPGILPFRPRPRPGYGSLIFPFGPFGFGGFGLGFGGPCFFNGFTSVCGGNPFFLNGYGGNCYGPMNYWNCGYGYGGGFGLGYGYGYGPGYGWDSNSYSPLPSTDTYAPDTSPGSDAYGEYIGNGSENAQPNPVVPQAPPTQIILKNGSAYEVTAYWLSDGELYYRPVTGGLNHVPLEQLDLAATVRANSRNGVTFTLTDRPPQD